LHQTDKMDGTASKPHVITTHYLIFIYHESKHNITLLADPTAPRVLPDFMSFLYQFSQTTGQTRATTGRGRK